MMKHGRKKLGKLIVFEGIDGAGKSTQMQKAARWLETRRLSVLTLREPTDGPHGQKLRESASSGRLAPEAELELFLADRQWNVETCVRPALERGQIVLLDRYYFSTIAYQGARGLDVQEIRRRNDAIAITPTLVLLFDLDPEIALERIQQQRGERPNLFEKLEYLRRVREIFLPLDDSFIRRIDASGSETAVWQQVENVLRGIISFEQD